MNALIKVQIGREGDHKVDARELHTFLEIGKDFSTWISDRIDAYGFLENVDYFIFSPVSGNNQKGRPSKEYAISLDMAKELAMVERNEKGKQARQYFIECERQAKNVATNNVQHQIPQTFHEALRLAADLSEQANKAKAELAIVVPKANALDRIATHSDGAVCLRVAAKLLQIPEKQFLQFANAEGFIFRHHHSRIWQGYSEKVKAGFVELKLTTVERDDGSAKTVEQVLITRAGIAKLSELIERKNECLMNSRVKTDQLSLTH